MKKASCFVLATCLTITLFVLEAGSARAATSGGLLNLDFTAHLAPGFTQKKGPAAIGQTGDDYWNIYSRDLESMNNWRESGELTGLLWSDGTASSISVLVTNAAGAWGVDSADPMFQTYLYPLARTGPMTVKFTQLPPGRYDLYFYAHGAPDDENGVVEITAGALRLGPKATSSSRGWNAGSWKEGAHYVLFAAMDVSGGDLTILVQPGASGLAVMNGLQLRLAPANPSCVSPDPALIGWWPAEGNGRNAMGGEDGNPSAGVGFEEGKVGRAFAFDGAQGHVKIPFNAKLVPETYTVEAWVKPASPVADREGQDLIFGQALGAAQFVVQPAEAGIRVRWQFGVDSFTYPGVSSIRELPLNVFSHIAGTWDGTRLRLFLNGRLEAETTPGFQPARNNCDFFIGGFVDACGYTGQFFEGLIDEVSFYRRPLTDLEIQSLFEAGSAGKCSPDRGCASRPDGLLSWWRGEQSGADSVSQNHALLSEGVSLSAAKVGQGFLFNGINGRAVVSNNPALNLGIGEALSIEGWIKVDAASRKHGVSIVDKRLAPASVDGIPFNAAIGYSLYLVDGRLGFQLADAPLENYRFHDYYSPSPDLRDGQFHHVAVTVDRRSVSGGALYVDGQSVLTFDPTLASGDLSNTEPFRIGHHASDGFDGFFPGIIDELSVYKRALAAGEVRMVCEAGSAGKCIPPSENSVRYDLASDWSDHANPNGPWTYRAGSAVLPRVTDWQLDVFVPSQGGWAFESTIPFWFRSSSPPIRGVDWQLGDVIVHTHVPGSINGPTNGAANVTWTSPQSGSIDVTGFVWEARDIPDLGGGRRGNQWKLHVGEKLVSTGIIGGGDDFSRSNPLRLELGSGGIAALQDIRIARGEVVRLEFMPTGLEGDYVGVGLSVSLRSSPVTGPVTYWHLDEQAGTETRDSVGGLHGKLSSSGAAFRPGGVASNALALDRTANGYATMGNVLPLLDTDFTMIAWIRMNAGDTTPNSLVLSKHEAGVNNGYFLVVNRSNDFVGREGKAAFFAGDAFSAPTSTSEVNDGRWHQLTAVHEAHGNNILYVDGVREGTQPSLPILPSSAPFLLGGASFDQAARGLFTGFIDEVQVYASALDSDAVARLWMSQSQSRADHVWVSTLAGSGAASYQDGIGPSASFNSPNAGFVGPDQAAYIADTLNHVIRRVDLSGNVSTWAGTGLPGAVDGPVSVAQLRTPLGTAVDRLGTVFVADTGNNCIRKISRNSPRQVSTYAGNAVRGYVDGPLGQAQFDFPTDLVIDPSGNIYVSEFNNHTVRRLAVDGMVSTLAGNGRPGFADSVGVDAGLNQPSGLGIDQAGNLYVTEWGSHRIRKITPAGEVRTVAGSVFPGLFDAQGLQARFFEPDGIVVDSLDNLIVSEHGNHTLRRISPSGDVITLAGTGKAGFLDGNGYAAQFYAPGGVGIDPSGNLVVADTGNHRVRRLSFLSEPRIIVQPQDQSVVEGSDVKFVVQVAESGPLTFQWRRNGVDLAGASGPVLRLSNVQSVQAGGYSVVVRNPLDSAESVTAALVVLEPMRFSRSLPTYYAPGVSLTVRLTNSVSPNAVTTAYAVEDTPPQNWMVTVLSAGGVYDLESGKVKFGPFFDSAPRLLAYQLTPPLRETGSKGFAGLVSADGSARPILGADTILPPPLHPSDLNPPDQRISIDELTAYASAWRKGQPWSLAPTPIPLDYVTRSGFLWKHGEVYQFDPSIPSAPLWWVSVPAVRSVQVQSPRFFTNSFSSGSGARVVASTFVLGEPFTVRITAAPAPGVSAYAIEEHVPAELGVRKISQGGEFDPENRMLRWGPFFDDSPREVEFELISEQLPPPVWAKFHGVISFDGLSVPLAGPALIHLAVRLSALARHPNGELELGIGPPDRRSYAIQASRDLRQWSTIGMSVNQTGVLRFSDPESSTAKEKFYRAVILETP